MNTTQQDISAWFDRGVADGRKFMLVICDTFDYDDFPSFFDTKEDAQAKASDPGHMQRTMEAYDLTADKDAQISAGRAWCLS